MCELWEVLLSYVPEHREVEGQGEYASILLCDIFGVRRLKDGDGRQTKEVSLNVQEKGDRGKTFK